MVDVGYFINGKHGVIKNCEIHNYSDTMKYISFEKGKEIYVIQYKEIEYIIPSNSYLTKNDEGKFDYNVVYTTDGVMRYHHSVPKSKLADVIADAFENGGENVSIGRVEREDDNT